MENVSNNSHVPYVAKNLSVIFLAKIRAMQNHRPVMLILENAMKLTCLQPPAYTISLPLTSVQGSACGLSNVVGENAVQDMLHHILHFNFWNALYDICMLLLLQWHGCQWPLDQSEAPPRKIIKKTTA